MFHWMQIYGMQVCWTKCVCNKLGVSLQKVVVKKWKGVLLAILNVQLIVFKIRGHLLYLVKSVQKNCEMFKVSSS